MSIIGGALLPAAMGKISDISNIQKAFIVPLICYLYVIYFAVSGYRPETVLSVAESAAIAEAK
jgi:FHS family L-fucose permease-like MFS transporter